MAQLNPKGLLTVRLKPALIAIAATLLAAPAAAQAAPPLNDNFSGAGGSIVQANAPGSVLPHASTVQWSIPGSDPAGDIDDATTEGGESLICDAVATNYGKTVWYRVHPDVSGLLNVRTTGGDAVLRVMSIKSGAPSFGNSVCQDDTDPAAGSFEEIDVTLEGGPGLAYAIQVGVYGNNTWPSTHLTRITFFRDRDLDGTFDPNDRCQTVPGPANRNGCVDTDGDGLVDIDDRCRTQRGSAGLRGCPDGDGDLIADIDDRCPGQRAATGDANGCLDLRKFGANIVAMPNSTAFSLFRGRYVRNGVRISNLTVSGLPSGTAVQLSCSRGVCRKTTKRGRKVNFKKQLKGKRLRPGKRVIVRVSRSGYVTRRFVIKAKRRGKRGVSRSNRCVIPGTKRLASCSKVSTIR